MGWDSALILDRGLGVRQADPSSRNRNSLSKGAEEQIVPCGRSLEWRGGCGGYMAEAAESSSEHYSQPDFPVLHAGYFCFLLKALSSLTFLSEVDIFCPVNPPFIPFLGWIFLRGIVFQAAGP